MTLAPPLGRERPVVTLVEGQTFCISGRTGDVHAGLPEGLFVLDTRVLSQWELRVDGHGLVPLSSASSEPFAATFVSHAHPRPGVTDADVVVFRRRNIGVGMREEVTIENYGMAPAALTVELDVDVDFAGLFEVKEDRVAAHGVVRRDADPDAQRFTHRREGISRRVVVTVSQPAVPTMGGVRWDLTVGPHSSWTVCIAITVAIGDRLLEPTFRCGGDDTVSIPQRELSTWRATLPDVKTDNADLGRAVATAGSDLGSLRIFDPDHPEQPVLAAGAPWFMALFGRDSLLTAWMTLIADPSLARGVLETLARLQGSRLDAETQEEPGKILHELRFGSADAAALAHGHRYFGSIDSTPLFVMLLGELRRWGHRDDTDHLIAYADRALQWIEEFGDRDGDGYVEYERSTPRGLVNQGWKDSWDAIRFADGALAEAPIALCEVQGYVYAAYLARAHIADELGDATTRDRFRDRAASLFRRFNDDFWSEKHGFYVIGLDRDKRPIDSVASNIGHCLWTGIVDPARAPAVADRLLSDDLFSGWGVRTLARSMAAFNPVSYHNGSVWPHDNAICASGLTRYGFTDQAHRILEAQLEVAAASDGRLPELFAGFDRRELDSPASYPTSCSPQAWASASPLLWIRTLLRLDPWAGRGIVNVCPQLPSWVRHLEVRGISLGTDEMSVVASRRQARVTFPRGTALTAVTEPRAPLRAPDFRH
jgi:glycogen debranching enzyme